MDVELETLPLPPSVPSVSAAADRRTVTEEMEATQLTDVTEVATLGVEAEANRLLLLQLLRSTELTVVAASVDVELEALRLPPCRCRQCRWQQIDGGDRGADTRCGGRCGVGSALTATPLVVSVSVAAGRRKDGDGGRRGHAAHGRDRGGDTRCERRGKPPAAAAAAAIDRADSGGGVGGCGVGDASTATVAVPSVSVAADGRR